MAQNYEMDAKRAMVEAVEERYRHEQAVKQRAKEKRIVSNILSTLMLLVVGGGLAWYIYNYSSTSKGSESLPKVSYAETVTAFADGKVRPWKEAPQAIHPNKAAPGETYFALVPSKGGDCELFTVVKTEPSEKNKSGLIYGKILPYRGIIRVTAQEFNTAREPYGCLLRCRGQIYTFGKMTMSQAESIRASLPTP